MNSNQMMMNHPRGRSNFDSDSCSESILSSSVLSQPASDLGRNKNLSNLNTTAPQTSDQEGRRRRKIFEPIQQKKNLAIPNSIDDHESQLESILSSRIVSNRSSNFNENAQPNTFLAPSKPKTETTKSNNHPVPSIQNNQKAQESHTSFPPPIQNPSHKNSIVVETLRPQDFQFESNAALNLDTSMASTITATTTFRRRIKPIVVMNINISSDKKEEVNIYEDSNPIEVAENFCRFHNLPFTLVEVLSNNIRAQIQNYYRIKNEKRKEDSICKSFFNQDTSIIFHPDSRKPKTMQKSLHYLDTIEPDHLNEETFEHHPEPQNCPQNPALKQSVSQEENFLRVLEQDRIKTEPDYPTDHSEPEPNKKLKLKIKQKLLDLNLIQNTIPDDEHEHPMETTDRQNMELQEIDDEIEKLQKRREEIYEKYGSTRPQTTKASASPMINFKPTQKFVKLKFKNEKKIVNKENIHTPNHKKASALDFDFDFENNNAHTPKLKGSNRKSRSTVESDSKKFTARPSARFFEDYIQNPEQMYTETTSYAQIHREREERRLLSQSKNKSFSVAASKSPKSGRKKSATPEKNVNSPFFNRLGTPQRETPKRYVKTGYSSGKKDNSLNILFSETKSNNTESFTNSFYAKQNADKDREERLLRTTLNQIFNSLDDDADGRISIEKVDVSTLQPEILEELAEIFQALEDDMELTFQDFYNIVNRKRLLERLKKDFHFSTNNNNNMASPSIFRIET